MVFALHLRSFMGVPSTMTTTSLQQTYNSPMDHKILPTQQQSPQKSPTMPPPFYHICLHVENEDMTPSNHIVPKLFDS
jgi:hypothetical protein